MLYKLDVCTYVCAHKHTLKYDKFKHNYLGRCVHVSFTKKILNEQLLQMVSGVRTEVKIVFLT